MRNYYLKTHYLSKHVLRIDKPLPLKTGISISLSNSIEGTIASFSQFGKNSISFNSPPHCLLPLSRNNPISRSQRWCCSYSLGMRHKPCSKINTFIVFLGDTIQYPNNFCTTIALSKRVLSTLIFRKLIMKIHTRYISFTLLSLE